MKCNNYNAKTEKQCKNEAEYRCNTCHTAFCSDCAESECYECPACPPPVLIPIEKEIPSDENG